MCLIEVAKFRRQPRTGDRHVRVQLLGRFVEAKALDHPFGADADVLAKQPLERARTDAGLRDQIAHFGDAPVEPHAFDQRIDRPRGQVGFGEAVAQEILRQHDHRRVVVEREHRLDQRLNRRVEHVGQRDLRSVKSATARPTNG